MRQKTTRKLKKNYRLREGASGGSQLEEGAVVEGRRPSRSGADEVRERRRRVVGLMVEAHLLLHLAKHSLRLLAKAVVVAEYR